MRILAAISVLAVVYMLWSGREQALQQPQEQLFLIIEPGIVQKTEKEPSLLLRHEDEVLELPLEEYLKGVLLSEMPVSFEPEALKAQAVAARTFSLRQMSDSKHDDCDLCSDSRCCQAWSSAEKMEDKLGASWKSCWDKVSAAVDETEGEVLTYNGELIEAVYFSCSGGMTEPAAAVWGTEVPYLQSVDSPGEEKAAPYESSKEFTAEEFSGIILSANSEADLSGQPSKWIKDAVYTQGGGVDHLEIGGQRFEGTQLRELFGLNSTKFEITAEKDSIQFHVYGNGHRVGMSQYGANAMAKSGAEYSQILRHYYSGIKIEKHP